MSNYTGYIYSITNELNGKTYIGKTNNLVRRWKEHCYGQGSTAILDKAFKKYGLEHFVFDIVAQIPFDTIKELNDILNQLEVYYISLYDTFNNGYNATAGGEGTSFYHHSEETKRKISQGNTGKIRSEAAKEKCRIANLKNNHVYYKKPSLKIKGRKRDHDMIMRGAIKRRKPILQYDMKGNFIQEYAGIKFADGFERQNISACCNGRLISTGGYMWRFKESDTYPLVIDTQEKWTDRKRRVAQYSREGILVAEFDSITEASKATGIPTGNICQCLKGNYNFTHNCTWRYIEQNAPSSISVPKVQSKHATPVLQCDKEHNIINEFPSVVNAASYTGIGRTSIKNCLRGLSKTAGGYIWEYKSREE